MLTLGSPRIAYSAVPNVGPDTDNPLVTTEIRNVLRMDKDTGEIMVHPKPGVYEFVQLPQRPAMVRVVADVGAREMMWVKVVQPLRSVAKPAGLIEYHVITLNDVYSLRTWQASYK